ncbi:hypothetical protein O999_14915 [Pseudomonas putida LF54]|nr:hypothetical protein O999_14915 [Pseudomonas putida LF54]
MDAVISQRTFSGVAPIGLALDQGDELVAMLHLE